MDILSVRPEPVGASLAQLALSQWPALVIGVPGELGSSDAAAADGALRRVSARKQFNLSGHALFSLEARVVGRDASEILSVAGHVGEAFLLGRESLRNLPLRERSRGVKRNCARIANPVRNIERRHHQVPTRLSVSSSRHSDWAACSAKRRRHHQPAHDEPKRDDVATTHACPSSSPKAQIKTGLARRRVPYRKDFKRGLKRI
jgi:hypothetical protein